MSKVPMTAGAVGSVLLVGTFVLMSPTENESFTSTAVEPSGMIRGAVELVSAGPLTFGPDGTLFLGDSYGSAIYAVDLEEEHVIGSESINVEGIDARVASLLGAPRAQVEIHDIAVSPVSRAVYLTASRHSNNGGNPIKNSRRPGATSHLIRVDSDGADEVLLDDVLSQRTNISDVRPQTVDRNGNDRRAWNILELAFVDGTLYASGLSNEEWSAKLRRIEYPFNGRAQSDAIRIFHTAHGRYETDAPARVFAPYEHEGEMRIFAGFSCTPLVDFSIAEMDESERVDGKTIAELGAGNHVLDMISVRHGDETYFLLANHLHDFMRLARSNFDGARRLDRPMGRAGIERTPMPTFDGVVRLASDRDERVVLLQGGRDAGFNLRTESIETMLR